MLRFTYLTIAAAFLALIAAPQDASAQSAKAAAQVVDMVILDIADNEAIIVEGAGGSTTEDTAWASIMSTALHTAKNKDLFISPSLECMLVTETKVKGKNSNTTGTATNISDESSAESSVHVRVWVDLDNDGNVDDPEEIAYPQGGTVPNSSGTAAVSTADAGITYCQRRQELEALFGGIMSCVDGADDGTDITLDECSFTEEELRLLLNSTSANTFNFVFPDMPSGTHTVTVQARIVLSAAAQQGSARARAGIGRGTVLVEEVRLVKDQDGLICDGVNDDASCLIDLP